MYGVFAPFYYLFTPNDQWDNIKKANQMQRHPVSCVGINYKNYFLKLNTLETLNPKKISPLPQVPSVLVR